MLGARERRLERRWPKLKVYVPDKLHELKPLRRPPLVPERVDVFEGDQPAEEKVSAFLARVIPAAEEGRQSSAGALVAWVCDVLLSEYSVRAYGRDLAHCAPWASIRSRSQPTT